MAPNSMCLSVGRNHWSNQASCAPAKGSRRVRTLCSMLCFVTRSPNPVLPPTELYNEGWLLRLVLDWLDRQREIEHPLSFMPGARWYSEALLPSRFLPRTRGDRLAESFTHADGLIGHFDVDSGQRGDARLRADVQQFIVTEAKLGSKLSRGTKNAPDFDQAARNVACIAHMLSVIGVAPLKVRRLGFFVVAPLAQIESGVLLVPQRPRIS